MKVLIACEFSGVVRDAFRALGHDAWSCDLLPSDRLGPHTQGDVLAILDQGWDLMIAHPPCTHLCSSGARWFAKKQAEQLAAIAFVKLLWAAPIARIAIENPIGVLSTRFAKPTQIIQPWQFGHPETKATCLWLRGLPPLHPTNDVRDVMLSLPLKERTRIHYASPGPERWKLRSVTYSGIAAAMAAQWGALPPFPQP